MIAKETLYLTADRQTVVKEGHKDAQFLLVREGQEISDADADRYGVSGKKLEPAAEAASAAAPPPPAKAPAKPAKKSRK